MFEVIGSVMAEVQLNVEESLGRIYWHFSIDNKEDADNWFLLGYNDDNEFLEISIYPHYDYQYLVRQYIPSENGWAVIKSLSTYEGEE